MHAIKFYPTKSFSGGYCYLKSRGSNNKLVATFQFFYIVQEWFRLNGHRSWKAVSSVLFPGIKDLQTINKHLSGMIVTGKEKDYCKILTLTEKESLLRYIKNRNR